MPFEIADQIDTLHEKWRRVVSPMWPHAFHGGMASKTNGPTGEGRPVQGDHEIRVGSRHQYAYWIVFAKPPRVISTRIVSPIFLFPWSSFVCFPT